MLPFRAQHSVSLTSETSPACVAKVKIRHKSTFVSVLYVCVRARAYERACVRACACVCVCVYVCVSVCVCCFVVVVVVDV